MGQIRKHWRWVAFVVPLVAVTVMVMRPGRPARTESVSTPALPEISTAAPPVQIAPLRPRVQATNLSLAASSTTITNGSRTAGKRRLSWLDKLEQGTFFSPEQLEDYFQRNGTNVETLLAASQLATNRAKYIKMAAELNPNDPRVQFAVLGLNVFPDQRREWLEKFKQSAPDNALADYLSARDYFQAGNRAAAMQELAGAMAKPHFNDYSLDQWERVEQAQLQAGAEPAEATATASAGVVLPHLAMMKGTAAEVETMQKEYLAAGDTKSAEALAHIGFTLAHQLIDGEGSRCLINQLVGVAIERRMLGQFPPDSQPEFLGKTVQDRIAELNAFRDSAKAASGAWNAMMDRGDEKEIVGYFDRLKTQGEYAAMQWLTQKDAAKR